MNHWATLLVVLPCYVGCAATIPGERSHDARPSHDDADHIAAGDHHAASRHDDAPSADLETRIAELTAEVAKLRNTVGHLESEIIASQSQGEFKNMTIDWVKWGDDPELASYARVDSRTLLCHVEEWNSFGRMLRFTRMADPNFELIAENAPVLSATMAEGGSCTNDGSTRFVHLRIQEGTPQSGATYRIRPRNGTHPYQWVLPEDLRVVRQ